MKNFIIMVMTVSMLVLYVVSCRSIKWMVEPEIKGAAPLSENIPVYIYFSSRMAGLKIDQAEESFNKPIRNYVLLAVVKNGKTEVNFSWDYYKDAEYKYNFNAQKKSPGQAFKPFDVDTMVENLSKGYFKKFVRDKKYFWIKPEGQKDVPPDQGHAVLGQGRVLWKIWYLEACTSIYSEKCVAANRQLEKKYYPELASYALTHGSNVVIITNYNIVHERDTDGKVKTETITNKRVTYYRDGYGTDKWWNETEDSSKAKWMKTETETYDSSIVAGYEYDIMFMRFDELISVKK